MNITILKIEIQNDRKRNVVLGVDVCVYDGKTVYPLYIQVPLSAATSSSNLTTVINTAVIQGVSDELSLIATSNDISRA